MSMRQTLSRMMFCTLMVASRFLKGHGIRNLSRLSRFSRSGLTLNKGVNVWYDLQVNSITLKAGSGTFHAVPVMQTVGNGRYATHSEAWDEMQRLAVLNPLVRFAVVVQHGSAVAKRS
jgi:hypothetical protein